MNKFSYGAAVLTLAFGVSGTALAQTAASPGTGPATDYPAGTTNLAVPASCTPTDVAAVRSDVGSVPDEGQQNQIRRELQIADDQLRDGNLAQCAQILADARAAIVQYGGKVGDTTALGVGGGTGVPATPSQGLTAPGAGDPAVQPPVVPGGSISGSSGTMGGTSGGGTSGTPAR
jgi:hypothetical protein